MPAASNTSRLGLPANTGLVGHVLDHDPFAAAALRCRRRLRPSWTMPKNSRSRGSKPRLATSLSVPESRVQQLDVAHVGGGDRDGGVHDLVEQRARVAVADELRAHLLEPPHAGQVGGQSLLGPLAFGDVPRDTDDPERPARRVRDPSDAGIDPDPRAVPVIILVLAHPLRARGAGADLLDDPRPLRLREAVGVGSSHHLRRGPTEEAGRPFIPERDDPLEVGGDDRVADVGQHHRVALQRLLDPDALGDVLDRAEHPHGLAGLVVDRPTPRLRDDEPPVLAHDAAGTTRRADAPGSPGGPTPRRSPGPPGGCSSRPARPSSGPPAAAGPRCGNARPTR